MKRFHVHVSVNDLPAAIRFYSTVFGAAPAVEKPDYAKWMLDDPRVNFAVSERAQRPGLNHLGLQVESAEELAQLRDQLESAGTELVEQLGASCCYARSDKYWITDPAGVAWEGFHSLDSVPVYGDDTLPGPAANAACCVPEARTETAASQAAPEGDRRACCG